MSHLNYHNAAARLLLVGLCLTAIATAWGALPDSLKTPEKIAEDLVKAFARHQSNIYGLPKSGDGISVDLDGSSDWRSRYFSTYRSLKYTKTVTPFIGDASGHNFKNSRIASLIAPGRSFSYQAEVESSEIKASASGSTSGGSFSLGATEKFSFITGAGALGNDWANGIVASISVSHTWGWSSADTDTDQVTVVPALRNEIPANTTGCVYLQTYATTHTQKGWMQVGVSFSGWVGVKQSTSDVPSGHSRQWKIDNAEHTYRILDFPELVKQAKAADLPQASEWQIVNGTAFLSYNLTLTVYMATDGWSHPGYNATSCSAQYEQFFPSSDTSRGGARHLLSTSGSAGSASLEEGLVNDFYSDLTDELRHPSKTSLPRRFLFSADDDNKTAAESNETIVIASLGAVEASNVPASVIVIAEEPGSSPGSNTNEQVAKFTGIPAPKPTSATVLSAMNAKAEARARAAAADGAVHTADANAGPLTLKEKIEKLVNQICMQQSDASCFVDYDGSSDYWEKYFAEIVPPLDLVTGVDDVSTEGAPIIKATTESHGCAAGNAPGQSTCILRDQDMKQKAHTTSKTSTWSIQGKIGWKAKIKWSTGSAGEFDNELTLDVGGTWYDGTTTSNTDGSASRMSVRVPMPKDHCAIINMTTVTLQTSGFTRAWLCLSGFVGVQQTDWKAWKDFSPGQKSRYRALSLPHVVSYAKDNEMYLGEVQDWYINEKGLACVRNTLYVTADVGVAAYVSPNIYHKDTPTCKIGPKDLDKDNNSPDDPIAPTKVAAMSAINGSSSAAAMADGPSDASDAAADIKPEVAAAPIPALSSEMTCTSVTDCVPEWL